MYTTTLSTTQKNQNISDVVAIVEDTHVAQTRASFKDLVTFAQENSTNQQPQPPLDLETVSMEREFLKLNSRTERSYNSDNNCQPNKHVECVHFKWYF